MSREIGVALVTLLLVSMILADVGAQSSCPMALTSLTPCLSSSVGKNNSSTPSAVCCSELANLAQIAPSCLCEALNIGGAQAVGFVLGRVLPSSFPGACNLQFAPMSQCDGLGSNPTNTEGSSNGNEEYSNGTKLKTKPLLLSFFITLLACISSNLFH